MNSADLIHNTASINTIYSIFDNDDVKNILSKCLLEKTIWRDGIKSERSLRIKTDAPKDSDDLITAFDLNPQLFPGKFEMAIAGDGQEYRRIRTLHSSSLISLLCFYGVSDNNPLILTIANHDIRFTKSFFEIKNLIGVDENGTPHESNMDVVLCGEDIASGKIVVFFLESKFSEYLSWGKHSKISNHVYRETYARLNHRGYLDRMQMKYEPMEEDARYSELASKTGRTYHYAGGIKQMVSHFLGVMNAAESKKLKGCDIYLGEIIFRFPDSVDSKGIKFQDYNRLYQVLAEGLNDLAESKFKVLDQCLTYQEVFKDYELDDAVRSFYSI